MATTKRADADPLTISEAKPVIAEALPQDNAIDVYSTHYPVSGAEREYWWGLAGEIHKAETQSRELELSNPQGIPSEVIRRDEALANINLRLQRLQELWCRPAFTVTSWAELTDEKLLEYLVQSHVPASEERINSLDLALLATRQELIGAFGAFTGMSAIWFKNVTDSPGLLAARKYPGQGGRGRVREPYFCPLAVMTWLTRGKRKRGRRLSEEKGWELLERHFPKVYAAHSAADPRG